MTLLSAGSAQITASVTDNRGTTTFTYEGGNDRVSSVTDPITGAVGYSYGISGERLSMTLPGGGSFTYSYGGYTGCILSKDDPNSLAPMLVHVTDDQGRRVDYWNDLLGRPFEVYSNQTVATQTSPPTPASYVYTSYSYDSVSDTGYTHNWLTEVANTLHVGSAGYGQQPTVTTLSQNDYAYDRVPVFSTPAHRLGAIKGERGAPSG